MKTMNEGVEGMGHASFLCKSGFNASVFSYPHLHPNIHKTVCMQKRDLRQILARNIVEAMEKNPALDTQPALAAKAGIAQSQVSRILRCEIGVGLDILNAIATALQVEPWELLADSNATRKAAVERMLWNIPATDERVERSIPPTPSAVKRPRG
jgi:transcriptional regulator with XRE-family HTH domain